MPESWILPALIAITAALYASVGHAGASGYIAILALWGLAPETLKPSALVLNLLVATIATFRFAAAGHFRWRLLWPFAITSIPCAWLGGATPLSPTLTRIIIGAALLFAAWRLFRPETPAEQSAPDRVPYLTALPIGAVIGFVSGLVGVGGGIFLSPVLILCGWAGNRTTAATSAAFILVNSAAGLLGHQGTFPGLPHDWSWWASAAIIGGWTGSHVGAGMLPAGALRRMLACVLVLAGGKLMLV